MWSELPDDVVRLILQKYKGGLRARIAKRPPEIHFFAAGRSYCETCDRTKLNVAWYKSAFRHSDGHEVYSACSKCRRRLGFKTRFSSDFVDFR
jgi:hypothetical protein